ncbi:hypothetical protein Tco_1226024, partial [Tanacetum coccineum]
PILLKEVHSDFGPTPFRFFHSWLDLPGFDEMISSSWASFNLYDSNAMIRFKKKLKLLKVEIRKWTKDFKEKQEGQSRDLNLKLRDIDKTLDQGGVTDDLLLSRMELMKQIQDIHKSKHRDSMQRKKVRWAIERVYYVFSLSQRAAYLQWVAFLSHETLYVLCIAAVRWFKLSSISAAYNSHGDLVTVDVPAFWNDLWIGDNQLKLSFSPSIALEVKTRLSVADKLNAPFSQLLFRAFGILKNGEGCFQVKDVRSVLDETFLPKENIPTRWVKSIPIKVNVFVWKLVQDRKDKKDKKKQNQSKTDKKREKTKSRVKTGSQKSKPDQPDTARKKDKAKH